MFTILETKGDVAYDSIQLHNLTEITTPSTNFPVMPHPMWEFNISFCTTGGLQFV